MLDFRRQTETVRRVEVLSAKLIHGTAHVTMLVRNRALEVFSTTIVAANTTTARNLARCSNVFVRDSDMRPNAKYGRARVSLATEANVACVLKLPTQHALYLAPSEHFDEFVYFPSTLFFQEIELNGIEIVGNVTGAIIVHPADADLVQLNI